jgi:hypothetical protein
MTGLEKIICALALIQTLLVATYVIIYVDVNTISSHQWALNECIKSGMCHP